MTVRSTALAALSSAAAVALTLAAQPAHATVVATISGNYDLSFYDTPALVFHNTSGGTLINAQMVLFGYQAGTLNAGATATVNLGTLAAGDTTEIWGFLPGAPAGTTPGNLTAYDYDDEWGNTPSGFTSPKCTVGGALCSLVGNFQVTFTATISGGPNNGAPVFSVFSPTTNFTGGFVGWQGLDPTGLSETTFDAHSGSITGTLAEISIGVPPGVPEPSTWAMMLIGFAGLGFMAYRQKKAAGLAAA